MDAQQVTAAFQSISRFRGERCKLCLGTSTHPTIYEGVILVGCDECGHVTSKGRLPEQARKPRI